MRSSRGRTSSRSLTLHPDRLSLARAWQLFIALPQPPYALEEQAERDPSERINSHLISSLQPRMRLGNDHAGAEGNPSE